MSFSTRFLQLRKEHGLTQPQMADKVGIHLTQVRRYESGEAQPSLEILKRIAVTFSVSADWLIFEDGEREPQDELKLKLKFEAIKQMDEEELKSVTSVLDALILKHQARRVLS
ncbi:helix-turn-helix transcriptional regulator [Escherichia coli]|nr:helix-turn-helix transcriptional regulator [Escherichia coli]EGI3998687.1 helix-turn-helix transcriptional regulator [Escherichia coli]EGJ6614924.1 helix-turn-helix transcriptional regulator [Escherichia coli]EHK7113376.1 helix-turn-helix transcriptional regulator [Escherichia coli]EHK7136078.1 helix-turn-helix transcriptional regulator [Escherichia coli]